MTMTLRRWRREPPVWTVGLFGIRQYGPADHETVFRLHREALADVGLRPGDGVYYDDDFDRLEEIYLQDRGEFLVGDTGGEVIAMGGLRRIDGETAEMVRLRVRTDLQGMGYGSAIAGALEERAVELGYRKMRCDTTIKQSAAIAMYRRSGWREVGSGIVAGVRTIYFEKETVPVQALRWPGCV